MKKTKVILLLVSLVAVIFAIAAASLPGLSFLREVEAGTVYSDVHPDVALRFMALPPYEEAMVLIGNSGEILIDLDAVSVVDGETQGFYVGQVHTIGDETRGIFSLINNSILPVRVSFDDGGENLLQMFPVAGSTELLYPGEQSAFYFILDGTQVEGPGPVTGTLRLEKD
ncbi:MAG: hypothetical protein AVO33_11180 [delta proteobacterium ML8_F1]|nr:MAG: hypothetical protein AVO33_11180 [delta proteobacterium ML8_F1]